LLCILLVGKRTEGESERRKNEEEEPSRKRRRQARSCRPIAIMNRVNTPNEGEQNERKKEKKRKKERERQNPHCTHTYIEGMHQTPIIFPFRSRALFLSCTVIVMFILIVAIIVYVYNERR
jgi:hypothetical protein